MKVFADKRILNDVQYYSLNFRHNKRITLALGWALNKGDWWHDGDPSKAKFLDVDRKVTEKSKQFGIYLGRLGIVYMIMPRPN